MAFPFLEIAQMGLGFINNFKQGRLNAKQMRSDAAALRTNARRTADEVVENETNARYETAQQLSDFAARMAARGISTTSDLFLNTYMQNFKNAEKNILNERQRGVNEYFDLNNQADMLDYQAKKAGRSFFEFIADPAGIFSGWS